MYCINKNKKSGRGKKRSEKGEGKRKEEEAREEEGTYVSFSIYLHLCNVEVGCRWSSRILSFSLFSFSLFVSGVEWRRLAEGM